MKTGILLMAHGSPDSVDQRGDCLRHVPTQKPSVKEIIAELQSCYRQIGGRSPLLDEALASAAKKVL